MIRLKEWIVQALTRTEFRRVGRGKKIERVELPPSERLVYGLYFAFIALIALISLEALYIVFLRSFNNEIFAAITGNLKDEPRRWTELLELTLRDRGTPETFRSILYFLMEHNYVERPKRGVYQITEKGLRYLNLLSRTQPQPRSLSSQNRFKIARDA